MWLVAGLAHEVIFKQFFRDATDASHEGAGIIFFSYILLGVLMTYFYSIAPKGTKPILDGLKYGAFIGIVWVLPHGLVMAGAHGESISYQFVNGLWHVIEQGFGGGVIGYVYAKTS